MLIFSVSFQFFVCHSEEDILPWKGLLCTNTQMNCVWMAGFSVGVGLTPTSGPIAATQYSRVERDNGLAAGMILKPPAPFTHQYTAYYPRRSTTSGPS